MSSVARKFTSQGTHACRTASAPSACLWSHLEVPMPSCQKRKDFEPSFHMALDDMVEPARRRVLLKAGMKNSREAKPLYGLTLSCPLALGRTRGWWYQSTWMLGTGKSAPRRLTVFVHHLICP